MKPDNKIKAEHFLHKIFQVGIALKAINGIWEILIGILILRFGGMVFNQVIYFLGRGEILEDPKDTIINSILHIIQIPAGARIFAATYILIHGIMNIFLASQLYLGRLWAYLVMMGVTSIFIFYQIHRVYLHHSSILAIITVWDVIFVFLTWHEYQQMVVIRAKIG